MKPLYQTKSIVAQTALITGASAGIGEACALMLAEQGANLILVARRQDKLESVKDKIHALFPNISIRCEVCNIAEVGEIEKLAKRLVGMDVHILINNAGLALGTETGDKIPIHDTITMFNTNVIGLMALVNKIAPQMRERNEGDIVNISSVAAFDHYAGGAIYCATKSAVDAFNDCLRMDMVETNIRVIGINPGLVSGTEFSVVRFKGDKQLAATPYLGIECLNAMDIADQVVYAITRPMNVQIAQVRSYCNQQAHAKYVIARK